MCLYANGRKQGVTTVHTTVTFIGYLSELV